MVDYRALNIVVHGTNLVSKMFSDIGSSLFGLSRLVTNVAADTARGFDFSSLASVAFAGTVASSIVEATRSAAEFQDVMADVAAKTNDALDGVRIEEFANSMIKLSLKTTLSLTELGKGAKFLAQAGLSLGEIKKVLPIFARVSAITEAPFEETAQDVLTIARSFEAVAGEGSAAADSINQLRRITNVLTVAAVKSVAEIEDFAHGARFAAPIMADLGFSIEDLASSMAVMADVGLNAGLAGRAIRQAIKSLIQPTGKAAETIAMLEARIGEGILFTGEGEVKAGGFVGVLERMNKALAGMTKKEQLKAISSIFPTRASTAALKLIRSVSTKAFTRYTDVLNQSDKALEKLIRTMESKKFSSFIAQMKILNSHFRAIGVSIGQSVLPAATMILKVLSLITGVITHLTTSISGLIQLIVPNQLLGVIGTITGLISSKFLLSLIDHIGKMNNEMQGFGVATVRSAAEFIKFADSLMAIERGKKTLIGIHKQTDLIRLAYDRANEDTKKFKASLFGFLKKIPNKMIDIGNILMSDILKVYQKWIFRGRGGFRGHIRDWGAFGRMVSSQTVYLSYFTNAIFAIGKSLRNLRIRFKKMGKSIKEMVKQPGKMSLAFSNFTNVLVATLNIDKAKLAELKTSIIALSGIIYAHLIEPLLMLVIEHPFAAIFVAIVGLVALFKGLGNAIRFAIAMIKVLIILGSIVGNFEALVLLTLWITFEVLKALYKITMAFLQPIGWLIEDLGGFRTVLEAIDKIAIKIYDTFIGSFVKGIKEGYKIGRKFLHGLILKLFSLPLAKKVARINEKINIMVKRLQPLFKLIEKIGKLVGFIVSTIVGILVMPVIEVYTRIIEQMLDWTNQLLDVLIAISELINQIMVPFGEGLTVRAEKATLAEYRKFLTDEETPIVTEKTTTLIFNDMSSSAMDVVMRNLDLNNVSTFQIM